MTAKLKYDVIPVAEAPTDDATFSPRLPVVLVVDDERVIADTLSIILGKSGFTTMTAYDGTEALMLASAVTPDLLISDVVMPGMSGIDLAIAVTKLIPACKVLLFSGQAATIDLLADARENGHEFTTLTKPVHPTDMLRRVSECLGATNSQLRPELTRDSSQLMASLRPN
ncbi:MAG TPA: response regulator [Edaphobacter sp.]|jgi:DNA-binding NtrC family response regulator|nr:response regulator [Edaphobacter sp.]